MKAHIGMDAHVGLVHTVTATAANVADVADVAEVGNFLRGNATEVFGDAGYIGAERCARTAAANGGSPRSAA